MNLYRLSAIVVIVVTLVIAIILQSPEDETRSDSIFNNPVSIDGNENWASETNVEVFVSFRTFFVDRSCIHIVCCTPSYAVCCR